MVNTQPLPSRNSNGPSALQSIMKPLLPDNGRQTPQAYSSEVFSASTSRAELLQTLYQRIGMSISSADAMKIVDHLESEKVVSADEAKLMKAALSPQAVPLPLSMKDALCAGTLRSMILALAKRRPNA